MRFGMVVGNRPPGSERPVTTSATAAAISSPPNELCRTAATPSAHVMSTGAAALTTTTVRAFAAATFSMSSVWRPGSPKKARSLPSVSHSSLVPTTTTAASAPAAAVTARSISESPSSVRKPTRKPPDGLSPESNSTTSSTGRPLVNVRSAESRSWLAMPKKSVPPCGGGSVTPSRTSSPSAKTRARPAWASASWNTPSSSGTSAPWTRMDHGPSGYS